MFNGFKVISVTPYGRRRYVQLLAHYLEQAKGIIDEHHFWLNTQDPRDVEWLRQRVAVAPDFFRIIESDEPYPEMWPFRIHSFFRMYPASERTIYIRFDDDIVWMAPQAIEQLLTFRIANPRYFLVFPNTINNSLCTHLHQRMGLLPELPLVEYDCTGARSWRSWETAAHAHRSLLTRIRANACRHFYFGRWELLGYERCSINCISWFGTDADEIARRITSDEEESLACTIPQALGRPNCIAGVPLVSHFAYHVQRLSLEQNTNWFDCYKQLVWEAQQEAPQSADGTRGSDNGSKGADRGPCTTS